jgi:hypothetical protein
MFFKIVSVLVILLFSIGIVSAAGGPSPEDAGAGMIKKGGDLLILSLANALNECWQGNMFSEDFNENRNITEERGATLSAILTLVSANPNPQNIEPLEKFKNSTKYIWAFVVSIFIFGNPMINKYARVLPDTYHSAFGDRYVSDEKFIGTTFLLMASYHAPRLVLIVLDLSTALSKYFMLNVLDYIEPSLENAWMYLFMAIGELLLAVFFIVRPWAIDIFYGASVLFALWYFLGIWREEAKWAWTKFFKITFMQVVCVFVACVCLISIKWAGLELIAGTYVIMFVFIAYICWKFLFGNFGIPSLKGSAKLAILRRY